MGFQDSVGQCNTKILSTFKILNVNYFIFNTVVFLLHKLTLGSFKFHRESFSARWKRTREAELADSQC